ncbi:MAG: DUF86 domain-containing protein [Candidatus Omnitrophota bacterium]
MIDQELLQRKIALIEDDLQHLLPFEKLKIKEIDRDFTTQAVVERVLERVIGRALDINQHIIAEKGLHLERIAAYRDTFLRLVDLGVYPRDFAEKISASAGLRNVLVHEYNNINPVILQQSIGQAIKEFNEYTRYILVFLDRQKAEE